MSSYPICFCAHQDASLPRTVPGSTAFAASTMLPLLGPLLATAATRDNDKSINAREFSLLLQDLHLLDGSLSLREGVKVLYHRTHRAERKQ